MYNMLAAAFFRQLFFVEAYMQTRSFLAVCVTWPTFLWTSIWQICNLFIGLRGSAMTWFEKLLCRFALNSIDVTSVAQLACKLKQLWSSSSTVECNMNETDGYFWHKWIRVRFNTHIYVRFVMVILSVWVHKILKSLSIFSMQQMRT